MLRVVEIVSTNSYVVFAVHVQVHKDQVILQYANLLRSENVQSFKSSTVWCTNIYFNDMRTGLEWTAPSTTWLHNYRVILLR